MLMLFFLVNVVERCDMLEPRVGQPLSTLDHPLSILEHPLSTPEHRKLPYQATTYTYNAERPTRPVAHLHSHLPQGLELGLFRVIQGLVQDLEVRLVGDMAEEVAEVGLSLIVGAAGTPLGLVHPAHEFWDLD